LNQGVTFDFDICYRALQARDERFDGRFFTGVTSTGVYCRPICPARTPSRRNVRFFPHAGAAEAAGFRACRRCRPEASPGSPEWNTRADLVARAVRLIADGYVDEHGVSGLAGRLAVTERHLRRLLMSELGAGPLALARTMRLQTARRLLAETSMPVTEIAFASGFSSIRQFNASFQESYGLAPSALRTRPAPAALAGRERRDGNRVHAAGNPVRAAGSPARGEGSLARDDGSLARGEGSLARDDGSPAWGDGSPARGEGSLARDDGSLARGEGSLARDDGSPARGDGHAGGAWLTLRLACHEPFDAGGLLAFFAARAVPGIEWVDGSRYVRTVRGAGGAGLIEVTLRPVPRQVVLRVWLPRLRGAGQVVSRCRQLFDLDADPSAIAAVLAADPLLAPLVAARPGLRVPGAYDGFELAVRAVLGQQVSLRAARTFAARLVARFGGWVTPPDAERDAAAAGPDGWPRRLFPRAGDLAGADLTGLGLTTARQATLRALATAAASGQVVLDPGADPEETAARLSELPGVGPWTVSYVLMRALRDPDAFPAADLGLRRALARLGADPGRARRWRPWRAYAALYLWSLPAGGPASNTKE
jgi:AraC family transcriptional regulator of adaptative response / DNA-3-methyladenine glycosylase II